MEEVSLEEANLLYGSIRSCYDKAKIIFGYGLQQWKKPKDPCPKYMTRDYFENLFT